MKERFFEADLIQAAITTPLEVVNKEDDQKLDFIYIICKMDEDDVSTSAFGLIYTLSLLSFRDARAAGYSENFFEEDDKWLAIDMLRNLSFSNGELCFEADYVRGRRMKTTIRVNAVGILKIETSGRGAAVERWISTVQGKKVISVIQGEKA